MERTEFITVDTHTGGEPTRIVLDGIEADTLAGETVRERRDRFEATADGVRKLLMQEPRGHADMFGAVPSPDDRSDLGVSSWTLTAISICVATASSGSSPHSSSGASFAKRQIAVDLRTAAVTRARTVASSVAACETSTVTL